MKKFLSTLLVFSTIANCSMPSSALGVQVNNNLTKCEADFDKYKYLESSNDMGFMILGSIELKANPDAMLRNSKYVVEIEEEPTHRCFNIFKPLKFLRKFPEREKVNNFKIDGVKKERYWFNFPGRLKDLIFGNEVSVEYFLVPLNSAEAKAFKEKRVKEGEKKPETKANEALLKQIKTLNKDDDDYAYIYEEVVKRIRKGLECSDLERFDPFNVAEKGSLADYENGAMQHNQRLLSPGYAYTKKEADVKNKQISADRIKVYNDLMYEHGTDFKQCGDVAELTEKSPSKYFLIVVKEKEAYKLRKLIELNGMNFVYKDKSKIEFSIRQEFEDVPADAKISERERNKIIAEVNSTNAERVLCKLAENKSRKKKPQVSQNRKKLTKIEDAQTGGSNHGNAAPVGNGGQPQQQQPNGHDVGGQQEGAKPGDAAQQQPQQGEYNKVKARPRCKRRNVIDKTKAKLRDWWRKIKRSQPSKSDVYKTEGVQTDGDQKEKANHDDPALIEKRPVRKRSLSQPSKSDVYKTKGVQTDGDQQEGAKSDDAAQQQPQQGGDNQVIAAPGGNGGHPQPQQQPAAPGENGGQPQQQPEQPQQQEGANQDDPAPIEKRTVRKRSSSLPSKSDINKIKGVEHGGGQPQQP